MGECDIIQALNRMAERGVFGRPSDEPLPGLSDVICMDEMVYSAYRMMLDRFGIYAQRKALNKAGVPTQVWRGPNEWWH